MPGPSETFRGWVSGSVASVEPVSSEAFFKKTCDSESSVHLPLGLLLTSLSPEHTPGKTGTEPFQTRGYSLCVLGWGKGSTQILFRRYPGAG